MRAADVQVGQRLLGYRPGLILKVQTCKVVDNRHGQYEPSGFPRAHHPQLVMLTYSGVRGAFVYSLTEEMAVAP